MVGDIRAFDTKLTEKEKKDVRYLLVSLDSKNDTPERLAKFAEKMRLDERWTLVNGSEGDVRETAAVLGFQYRKLGDGAYTHASTFYLLDREGRIASKKDRGTSYDAFLDAYRTAQSDLKK
jgi:protein SCO1/2